MLREKVLKGIVNKVPERKDGHYTVNHLKRFVRSASLPQDLRYLGFLSINGNHSDRTLFSEPDRYRDNIEYSKALILQYYNSENASEPMDRMFYCDMKTYLPEDILACTDRMSMRHSLEVRVPFLDHKLVEFCATIPHEKKVTLMNKKVILKKALKNILPDEVLKHRKQGFVGPMSLWLKNDLKQYVLEILSEKNLCKHGILNKNTVKTLLEEHFNGREMHDKRIWSLVMFQSWYNLYIDRNIL